MIVDKFLDTLVILMSILTAIIVYAIVKLFFNSVYSGMLYLLFAVIISATILLVVLICEYLEHKRNKYRQR